jgi:putative serine protease PepD
VAGPAGTLPAPSGGQRRGGSVRAALIGGLVGAIVAGGVTAAALWDRSDGSPQGTALSVPSRPSATVVGEDLDIQSLLARVGPSVVSIHTGVRGGEAAGSGLVISEDGVVLTNAHVIDGAQTIEVDFADGRTAEARVLGTLPEADVAVVQAEGLTQPVPAAELGSSSELQVGDSVVAIGNALNLGEAPSVTTGIVSALNRSIIAPSGDALDDLIQTDAAINPGNSGGPLINSRGQVVGINTAILADAQNIGFALSIDSIRGIVEDLRAGRQVENVKPLLGVETVDASNISTEVAERFGVDARSGAFVQRVAEGSGAAGAALQQGDVIVEIDGSRVRTATDVGQIIRARAPGDTVEIVYVRQGVEQRGSAVLGSR